MNFGVAVRLLGRLLEKESGSDVAKRLATLTSRYETLQQLPSDTNAQSLVAAATQAFRSSSAILESWLSDSDGREAVALFGAGPYTLKLGEEVSGIINSNSSSPSLIFRRLSRLNSEREAYFNGIRITHDTLSREDLSSEFHDAKPDEAEIGLLIPRGFFANELGKFAEDLKEFNFVVRNLSEIVDGAAVDPQLGAISSTDPWIWLHVSPDVGNAIVHIFHVAANVLGDLAKVKAGYEAVKALMKPAALKELEDSVEAQREEKISVGAGLLLEQLGPVEDEGRRNELKTGLTHSLKIIIREVEGGVTLHISGPADGSSQASIELISRAAEKATLISYPIAPVPLSRQIEDQSDDGAPNAG